MSDIKDVKLLQQQQQRIGIFISAVFNVQNKVNGSRRKRLKMFVFSCLVVQHCLSIKELSH